MSNMDFRVAEAIHAARLLERVVHDPGPWEMAYAGLSVPAVRWVLDDRVIFRAHFPDACVINHPASPTMSLLCNGETVSVRPVDEPADGEFPAEWIISTRPVVPVG